MKWIVWPFILFATLALAKKKQKQNDLVELSVDSFGDLSGLQDDYEDNDSGSIAVDFANAYANQSLHLFWEDDSGNRVTISDIPKKGSSRVDTFVNHKFFAATDEAGNNRVTPRQITVVKSKTSYSFGPLDAGVPSPHSPTPRSKHPLIKYLNTPTTATSAKFRNHIPATIDIYYDDGREGTFQGTLDLGKEYTINTYEGHVFYFTEKNNKKKVLARFTIDSKLVLYVIEDPKRPPPQSMITHRNNEEAFMAEYLNRTGLQWRHYYGPNGPRPPPVLHMWPTNHIGEKHGVSTRHNKWVCEGSAADCQTRGSLNMELEVISMRPKVFIIEDFLSDFEVESIKDFAKPKVKRSSVGSDDGGGARNSDTRTSRNTWVPRSSSAVTETLSLRAADLLKIDEKHLHSRTNAEDIQVVHYVNGQKYDSHHDWGVSGYVESRYITLLLYLTDMDSPTAGGETSFPKADGGMGLKVMPKKGTAVLFYNLLEDGNGDDLALHAALPIFKGEKWLANFWIWDPKRK